MTTKRIMYTRPDGNVSVVIPAPNARKAGETEDDFISRIKTSDVPGDAVNIFVGDASELPYRGSFRNAWRQSGMSSPVVDMPMSRVIKTDQIRPERDKRLVALDVDYMRADEAGDGPEKQRIAATKQALRDLPAAVQPELDEIATPEALEAWEPSWPRP